MSTLLHSGSRERYLQYVKCQVVRLWLVIDIYYNIDLISTYIESLKNIQFHFRVRNVFFPSCLNYNVKLITFKDSGL